MATFMSVGHFNLVNALTGQGERLVQGPVLEKKVIGGTRTTHAVVFQVDGRPVQIGTSRETLNRLRLGDTFAVRLKYGGLGYYYRTLW
jgi:hypothetical protein